MAKKKLKKFKILKKINFHRKKKIILLFGLISIAFLPVLFLLFYSLLFVNRIYPGVYVAGVFLGGLNKKDAELYLKENLTLPKEITFSENPSISKTNKSPVITTESINLTYNFTSSIDKAYGLDRSFDPVKNLILKLYTFKRHIDLPMVFIYDKDKLNGFIDDFSSEIYNEPIYPSIKAVNGQVIIEKGVSGQELDHDEVIKNLINNLSWAKSADIPISIKKIDVSLSHEKATIAYNRAIKYYSRKLILKFEDREFTYSKSEILKFIRPEGGYNSDHISSIINIITKEIEREPQNPVFKFQGGIVQEFLPAKDGVKVELDNFGLLFIKSLQKIEEGELTEITAEIPVYLTPPPNRTEDVNTLGIKELIGTGISYFRGSIASRIHNIGLASSRFNGILIAPGETLSFNKIVGDVSQFTGYQQAYIIQEGKTILGDGGGVCQVSTTLFRAVLDAGLPVLERRAHSYRVAYYEQYSPPGIDATVFYPTSDLKFKNDTANHILIQIKMDRKALKLTFEIYGTSDSRQSELTKPVVTRPVPPPEDLYTDDPTLPVGTVKQIDWKAWGAKVSFNYKVTRNGETLFEKIFISNYQPWQAKFLRGTGPVQ